MGKNYTLTIDWFSGTGFQDTMMTQVMLEKRELLSLARFNWPFMKSDIEEYVTK